MKAIIEFAKPCYSLLNNFIHGKNIRKRLNLDCIDKPDTQTIKNWQSKCSLDDKNANYEKINLYSFN